MSNGNSFEIDDAMTRPLYPWPTPIDMEQLLDHLSGGDEMLLTIRTHLYVETLLNEFLSVALKHPEFLDTDRIGFPLKVQLVASLGILPNWLMQICLSLNRVRNKMAHKLTFVISATEKGELWEAFPEKVRKRFKLRPSHLGEVPYNEIMKSIVVHVDIARHLYIKSVSEQTETFEYL
jgi:hypothetical protein